MSVLNVVAKTLSISKSNFFTLLLSAFQPEEVTFMSRVNGDGPVRARSLGDAPNIKERLGEDEYYLGELWYNLTEEELFCDV